MDALAIALSSNPLLYIGYILCLVAVAGVILFAKGFSLGVKHLITFAEESKHLGHGRSQAIQGIYLAMVALGIWEIIRVLFYDAPATYWWLILLLLAPLWIPWVKKLFSSTSGGAN